MDGCFEWQKNFAAKQGSLGPQKLRSLKSLTPLLKKRECFVKPSKLLPHQIKSGKTIKNVIIDPQTTEIWSKELNI